MDDALGQPGQNRGRQSPGFFERRRRRPFTDEIMVLDAIVIVVVLISAVLAMVRGLVREVLSIASWAVAAAAGYFFYKPLVPLVQPYVEKQIVAVIISVAVIFFVA